jgi:hypothetical protein
MSDPTKQDQSDDLDLDAEIVRDLDAGDQADDVAGGAKNTNACHTDACPTTGI